MFPEPRVRLSSDFVENKSPDTELPVTNPVIFRPLHPTGERGDEIIFAPEEIAAYPLLPALECKAAFKGGRGTCEEYGGMLCHRTSTIRLVLFAPMHRLVCPYLPRST